MENNEVTVIAGKCGEDIAFSFDGSVLRISGSGAMYNYTDPALTPFADFRSSVGELVATAPSAALPPSRAFMCRAVWM